MGLAVYPFDEERAVRLLAGQDVERVSMVIADASSCHGQRPHYGHMVGHPGTAGQMLAPFDAGGRGRDGLELAAVLDRRQGFHVPRVQLAGTAEEKNHDARLRASGTARRGT